MRRYAGWALFVVSMVVSGLIGAFVGLVLVMPDVLEQLL